ncbi:MAG: hypothetical protein JRH16_19685 [Deltaproteobacteria bacterium]|nr:hypothetical protein [Deltaproteobacteria bacterium]MBW2362931.1 hypothetical protein [Deltaproteobacteria bacterium]
MRTITVLALSLFLTLALALPAATALAETEEPAPAESAAEAKKGGKKPKRERQTQPRQPERAYEGSIAAVNAKRLSVVLRSGKTQRFPRQDSTAVRGHKRSWDDLAVGDAVKVRMRGKEIHTVVVQPNAAAKASIEEQREARRAQYEKSLKAKQSTPKKKRKAEAQ